MSKSGRSRRSSSSSSKSSHSSAAKEKLVPLTKAEKHVVWKEIVVLEGKVKETEAKLIAIEKKEEYLEQAEARRVKVEKEQKEATEKKKELMESKTELDEEEKRPKHEPRAIMGGQSAKRMFSGVLKILNTQKEKLAKDNLEQKRMVQLRAVEERVTRKQEEQDAVARQRETENLKENKEMCNELLTKLLDRVEVLRKMWQEIASHEQDFILSHYLITASDPPILWLPSKHTPETRRALEDRKSRQLATYTAFRKQFKECHDSIMSYGLSVVHSEVEREIKDEPQEGEQPAKRVKTEPQ